jgi:hypothetical protein
MNWKNECAEYCWWVDTLRKMERLEKRWVLNQSYEKLGSKQNEVPRDFEQLQIMLLEMIKNSLKCFVFERGFPVQRISHVHSNVKKKNYKFSSKTFHGVTEMRTRTRIFIGEFSGFMFF